MATNYILLSLTDDPNIKIEVLFNEYIRDKYFVEDLYDAFISIPHINIKSWILQNIYEDADDDLYEGWDLPILEEIEKIMSTDKHIKSIMMRALQNTGVKTYIYDPDYELDQQIEICGHEYLFCDTSIVEMMSVIIEHHILDCPNDGWMTCFLEHHRRT